MTTRQKLATVFFTLALITFGAAAPANADPHGPVTTQTLTTGLQGATGSTVGPDGALYVTEGAIGRITRVDPRTGATSTFAEGLPAQVIPLGGAIDVVFLGRTAYALVTLVNGDVGGTEANGIYRIDGPTTNTLIADLGTWSQANPPATSFDLPGGVQYAIERYRNGFVVSDGHHNRVLHVTRHGDISELQQFDNIVPTGMDVRGRTIYLGEAGSVPHAAADGKIVSLRAGSSRTRELAAGAPLLVDVERGPDGLYALAQGQFPPGGAPGAPANPGTGSLVRVDGDGGFDPIVTGLNLPTSIEFIRGSAYVVGLAGDVVRIDGIDDDHHGGQRENRHDDK